MRDYVILPMRFVVIIVLERSHILSSEPKRNERIAIIDCIELFSMKVPLNIVLNYSALSHSCIVRGSSWNVSARSKGKDVFVFSMLECVWIDVNESLRIYQRSICNFLLRFRWRLSDQLIEVLFNGLSSIYISEYSPVFSSRSL